MTASSGSMGLKKYGVGEERETRSKWQRGLNISNGVGRDHGPRNVKHPWSHELFPHELLTGEKVTYVTGLVFAFAGRG